MPTKAQHLNEQSSAKDKETKAKATTAAKSAKKREALDTSVTKKNSGKTAKTKVPGAKKAATAQSKSSAKATRGSASAKTKAKSSVNSTESKSATKKKSAETKTSSAKKPAKSTAKAKTAVKKAAKSDGKIAARRAEEARPVDQKETAGALEKERPAITSEAAKKIASNLIRSRAKKASEPRKSRTPRPIAFTLDEAIEIAKSQQSSEETTAKANKTPVKEKKVAAKQEPIEEIKQENRVLGAASLADILGYNPSTGLQSKEEESIPPKFQRYYKLLIELRNVVKEGLDMHTKETLNRSSKDDSGNLSAYSQHMADMGTETFDRDFALNLVSSEQEALFEIEDAIRRIKQGTYGVCEITGKPISKERLLAVPFARYSMEGQIEFEQNKRRNTVRTSILGPGEGLRFMETESDDD